MSLDLNDLILTEAEMDALPLYAGLAEHRATAQAAAAKALWKVVDFLDSNGYGITVWQPSLPHLDLIKALEAAGITRPEEKL